MCDMGHSAPIIVCDTGSRQPNWEMTMLAEIFLLRLEAAARINELSRSSSAASDTRFIPITPPRR